MGLVRSFHSQATLAGARQCCDAIIWSQTLTWLQVAGQHSDRCCQAFVTFDSFEQVVEDMTERCGFPMIASACMFSSFRSCDSCIIMCTKRSAYQMIYLAGHLTDCRVLVSIYENTYAKAKKTANVPPNIQTNATTTGSVPPCRETGVAENHLSSHTVATRHLEH